jgi:hypothetical protein
MKPETDLSKEDATKFFAELFYGEHHIPNEVKPFGNGWAVNTHAPMATTDFNNLTRFVLMCHDDCIRGEIHPAGPQLIKVCIWKRQRFEPRLAFNHPTIGQAIDDFRKQRPHA